MNRRAHGLVTSLLLLCSALPPPVWALRPVVVYEVDLDGQSATALQDAMREALVRATGRRESAQDPALGAIVAEAAKYVKSYASGPRNEQQVVFDAAALERAIGAAGRSLWDLERPFTLVVLWPPPLRADADNDRALLEHAAEQRGLPVSLIPLAVVDAGGNPLAPDALLQAAQGYGGDQVLVDAPTARLLRGSCSGRCTRAPRATAGAARSPTVSIIRSICSRHRRAPPPEWRRSRRACRSRV